MPAESQPLDVVPAPEHCPTCRAARMRYDARAHPSDAQYACLTTTRMLAAGFHGDPDVYGLATRALAVYRQYLKGLGVDPRDHDPMLR